MKTPTRQPATITVDEAAHVLGISRELAYRGVHNGEIPSLRIGRRILVPRERLDRLLREFRGTGERSP